MYKCTACSECFMTEEVFFAHTRAWHCKVLVSEGNQPEVDEEQQVSFGGESEMPLVDEVLGEASNKSSESSPIKYADTSVTGISRKYNICDDMNEGILDPTVSVKVEPISHTNEELQGRVSSEQSLMTGSAAQDSDALPYLSSDEMVFDNKRSLVPYSNTESSLLPHFGSEFYFRGSKDIYHCRLCGLGFDSNSDLQVHSRLHSNIDSGLTCKVCHKTFSHLALLKRHARVHAPVEKQFRCQLCQKSFNYACNLKVHMRVHSGERPYSCDLCLAAFAHSSNLKKHKDHKHPQWNNNFKL